MQPIPGEIVIRDDDWENLEKRIAELEKQMAALSVCCERCMNRLDKLERAPGTVIVD
jgi:tetrahydromethanopterin S-methyltransferase subunit G